MAHFIVEIHMIFLTDFILVEMTGTNSTRAPFSKIRHVLGTVFTRSFISKAWAVLQPFFGLISLGQTILTGWL